MDLVKVEDLQEEIGMLQVVIRRLVKMAGGGRRERGVLSQHPQLDRVGTPALGSSSGHGFDSLAHVIDLGLIFAAQEFLEIFGGGDEVVASILPGQRTDQVARTAEVLDLLSQLAIADLQMVQFSTKIPTRDGVATPNVE